MLRQSLAHVHLGQLPEARACLEQMLVRDPDHFDARYMLATVLAKQGSAELALQAFDAALRLRDNHPLAHNNRASLMVQLGRYEQALGGFDRAIALKPDFAAAWFRRGVVLQALGQTEAAMRSHERALELQPDLAEARAALRARTGGPLDLADGSLPGVQSNPTHPSVASNERDNQRVAREYLSDVRAAAAWSSRDLTITTDWRALVARGNALVKLKQYVEAAELFDQAMHVAPAGSPVAGLLLDALRASVNWDRLSAVQARIEGDLAAGFASVDPLTWQFQSDDPVSQLTCSRLYARHALNSVAPVDPAASRAVKSRLRVAYLSADFVQHPVMRVLAEVFGLHDRVHFEIWAYAYDRPEGDSMSERLRAGFDAFHQVHEWSDDQIARHMRENDVDVAVDLMGYTHGTRLGIFQRRPATVSVSLIGYPGTLGVDFMDYIVADAVLIPPEGEPCYSERVVRLPGCYLPVDRRRPIGLAPSREALSLPENGFVFCAFSNPRKISPEVFRVWMRLLDQLPGSTLWLVSDSDETNGGLRGHAERAGIDPDRLVFADRVRFDQYLARYTQADLFLDTMPYNALATLSDALWAGLPAITCTGRTYVGRGATSILRAAGVPELVTTSLAEYEALALRLARAPQELAALKNRLLQGRTSSTLNDTPAYTQALERAYTLMMRRQRSGLAPGSITVPAAGSMDGVVSDSGAAC